MDINEIVLNDAALEVVDKGEWMPAGEEAPDVEFLVTGIQAEGAQKFIKARQAKLRTQSRGKPLTEDQRTNILREALIEEILKDWRGLKSGGKDLPYSKDLARQFIMSRGGEKLTDMIVYAAQELDRSASKFVEEVAKN